MRTTNSSLLLRRGKRGRRSAIDSRSAVPTGGSSNNSSSSSRTKRPSSAFLPNKPVPARCCVVVVVVVVIAMMAEATAAASTGSGSSSASRVKASTAAALVPRRDGGSDSDGGDADDNAGGGGGNIGGRNSGRARPSGNVRLRLYLVRHGESAANRYGILAGQSDVPLTPDGRAEAAALGARKVSALYLLRGNDGGGGYGEGDGEGASSTSTPQPPFSWWRAYSSDLQRARETALIALREASSEAAAAAAAALDDEEDGEDGAFSAETPALILDPMLRERSYGARQGFPRKMAMEEVERLWDAYGDAVAEGGPPPYESDDELWVRARAWIEKILREVRDVDTLERAFADGDGDDKQQQQRQQQPPVTYHVFVSSHAGFIRQTILNLLDRDALVELGAKFDAERDNRLIVPNTSLTVLEFDPYSDEPMGRRKGGGGVRVVELLNADHLDRVKIVDD